MHDTGGGRVPALITKREAAVQLLGELLGDSTRIVIADAVKSAQERGISRPTLQRAAKDMGVRMVHNGPYGAFWEQVTNGGE
jgi:hypothetical protein